MNSFRSFALFLLSAFPLSLTFAASADCQGNDDSQFVCGPVSPEDLLQIPDSPWVVVSSMEDEGYLSVAHAENHSTVRLYPSAEASIAHDGLTYPDCPSPPAAQFRPHGVSLRSGSDGNHTLYVVTHGERESVEVYEMNSSAAVPRLTWVGCAVAPDGVSLNSVTALPDGGFAATNFNISAGNLWEWQAGTGWAEVPGSRMPGPNGLIVSEDGRWFYIGGWSGEAVVRLSRGQTPVSIESVPVGFHVDNVRWTDDGSILAAGQYSAAIPAIVSCLGGTNCDGVSTRVAKVTPDNMMAQQLLDYPSDDKLLMGTVAIEVGSELWVGAIAGGNKIGRFPQ